MENYFKSVQSQGTQSDIEIMAGAGEEDDSSAILESNTASVSTMAD